jgi:hypothetical protein
VPPNERGLQAAIESDNGWGQAKGGARFPQAALGDLPERSRRQVAAVRPHRAARIEAAPRRRAFPAKGELALQAAPPGQLISLRWTDEQGRVEVRGQRGPVSEPWPPRQVRAAVDRNGNPIRFDRLVGVSPRVKGVGKTGQTACQSRAGSCPRRCRNRLLCCGGRTLAGTGQRQIKL